MKKYCKFNQSVKDCEETIFHKNRSYAVTYEDDILYYFGDNTHLLGGDKTYTTAIGKMYEGKLFEVVES